MTREKKLIAFIIVMGVVQLITVALLVSAYSRLDDVSYDLSTVQSNLEETASSAHQTKRKVDGLQSDIHTMNGRIVELEHQSW